MIGGFGNLRASGLCFPIEIRADISAWGAHALEPR
jgi:hypothetical protein